MNKFKVSLVCKKSTIGFTKGREYSFKKSHDPIGLETIDDYGERCVFFNTKILFSMPNQSN